LKALKPIIKKSAKHTRERQVLMGLIELYLKTGKPIGSNTLKDFNFEELSSATIRNYFVRLEEEGYLSQQHTSGGRIPTPLAFRLYAQEYAQESTISETHQAEIKKLKDRETKELASYLAEAAELLSQLTNTAIFLSAPRFDHDYITEVKLVSVDHQRCVCIMLTSFGVIETEVLHIDKKLSSFSLKRIEAYFQWRLNLMQREDENALKPENLTPEEERLAHQFYNEIMMRYIVRYANFTDEDIYRTGFSKLLAYPELQDVSTLTNCLSLFENVHSIRLLLKECSKKDQLRFWIGSDLHAFSEGSRDCAVITVPYSINRQCVGAIGLLGPVRMPYRQLFGLLHHFSECISETLTRSIYKFKIAFRQPQRDAHSTPIDDSHSHLMLIEHDRQATQEEFNNDQ